MGERKKKKKTDPHIFLSVGPDKRITHDVDLERVQARSGRRLERHAHGPDLAARAHVGELIGRDKDSVQLVVADENVPTRFPVLFVRFVRFVRSLRAHRHIQRERENRRKNWHQNFSLSLSLCRAIER